MNLTLADMLWNFNLVGPCSLCLWIQVSAGSVYLVLIIIYGLFLLTAFYRTFWIEINEEGIGGNHSQIGGTYTRPFFTHISQWRSHVAIYILACWDQNISKTWGDCQSRLKDRRCRVREQIFSTRTWTSAVDLIFRVIQPLRSLFRMRSTPENLSWS